MTTEAQIALAREIVAQDWQHLGYPRYADEARAGEFDNDDDMRIALAAIQATTEMAAALIDDTQPVFTSGLTMLRPRLDGNRDGLAYAVAIRAGHHLHPHKEGK